MSLEQGLKDRLARLLSTPDERGSLGPRLAADAARLWDRLDCFIGMRLVNSKVDANVLELSCYALQLPLRSKPPRLSLRDRCEQAAELTVSLLTGKVDEAFLDQASKLLHETPKRSPKLDEARLLADAVNLDDFGLTGLVNQTIVLGIGGESVTELMAALSKREQYGYWEARLKDGFHFEAVLEIARRRLEMARKIFALLKSELEEDRPRIDTNVRE
jgi:hypothetical protein